MRVRMTRRECKSFSFMTVIMFDFALKTLGIFSQHLTELPFHECCPRWAIKI